MIFLQYSHKIDIINEKNELNHCQTVNKEQMSICLYERKRKKG